MQPGAATAVSERSLIDQAFTRASGAERTEGNRVRLLRDAAENYPAWLAAIALAERYIYFESYIIRDDATGRRLADALSDRARAGVEVRLLYDWVGALGKTSGRYWQSLRDAGVEVRCFNPFRLASPLGWVRRNHRKSLVVDGRVGFVTGLCVGDEWVGDAARGIAPWRDTGVEVEGPAVRDIERAFADAWSLTGAPIPDGERRRGRPGPAGGVAMRVVASEPNRAELLLIDQLVASAARETLWLADAYYAGVPSHVQALCSAAKDGVDVRLLLPGATDLPVVRTISRAGYRPLLEAGVRIFEWSGSMLHSKTAVADGRWARIGSTNLNLNSWIGNWELDVAIEDDGIARTMERHYEEDLARATEIVPSGRHRPRALGQRGRRPLRRPSARRALRTVTRLGHSIGAAVTGNRQLQSWESAPLLTLGLLLLGITALAWWKPMVLLWPIIVMCVWIGLSFVAEGLGLWRKGQDDP